MSELTPPDPLRYFVDEAGDPTLFSARGRVLVGEEGCSRFFILGMLQVNEPAQLGNDLDGLRRDLLADPYFKHVPSMQAERRKTALAFHAKDDVPEVRREVFRVLMQHDVKFFAVVREKASVLEYVQRRNRFDDGYRYQANELYDTLASRLFKNRLHLSPEITVCFARRGSSDRSQALRTALELGRARFASQWNKPVSSSIAVHVSTPLLEPALQAADYFLWALQRHYEREESRFLELVWPKVGVIHAVDETARFKYGEYYTKKKPLVG